MVVPNLLEIFVEHLFFGRDKPPQLPGRPLAPQHTAPSLTGVLIASTITFQWHAHLYIKKCMVLMCTKHIKLVPKSAYRSKTQH